MYHRTDLVYVYDGTFDGFLCCVFDAVLHKRFPVQIFKEEDDEIPALLPLHTIATDEVKAKRVRRSIPEKISPEILRFTIRTKLLRDTLAALLTELSFRAAWQRMRLNKSW